MEKRILFAFCFVIMMSGFVICQIAIDEPNEVYNLGDRLYITATNLKGSEKGNFNVDLVCQNTTINLLKFSARVFSKEGGQSYSIPYKILSKDDLEIDNIKSIVGVCYLKANLAEDVYETKKFTISDELTISGSINKVKYNPGEEIVLKLDVKKADGSDFEGEYEISNFTSETGEIIKGKLNKEIKVDDNLIPGEYFIGIEVFNSDSLGERTNEGSMLFLLVVNQIATRIDPFISSNEIIPGNEIKINPEIVDQAGGRMDGTITVHISDPLDKKYDYSVKSGETLIVPFDENSTKGSYKIYFVSQSLTNNVEFEMLGLEKVSYELFENVLIIKNVGNVDYFGVVEVSIGETIQEVKVELKVGEEKRYTLEAPTGEWKISVNDGKSNFIGDGFLTGNAISIKEIGGKNMKSFSFMWIFLIFLAGSFGIVMVGMYRNTRVFSKSSFKDKIKSVSPFKKLKKADPIEEDDKKMIDYTNKKVLDSAESSLVLDGEKLESVVVSINVKGKDSFSEEIQEEIVKIIKESCNDKCVIDVKEDFIYFIYSPLVTKSYRNELLAVKNSLKLSGNLTEYTKKLSGEFNFGIGVHIGDLVSKKEGRKLKYTTIGNTISFANKMAEKLDNGVLLSEKVRRILMHELKTTKVEDINGKSVFRVDEIKNRAQNQQKLKDLLNRMQKD
jgi:hypothetical protein